MRERAVEDTGFAQNFFSGSFPLEASSLGDAEVNDFLLGVMKALL